VNRVPRNPSRRRQKHPPHEECGERLIATVAVGVIGIRGTLCRPQAEENGDVRRQIAQGVNAVSDESAAPGGDPSDKLEKREDDIDEGTQDGGPFRSQPFHRTRTVG
jgi:hypothetical protein